MIMTTLTSRVLDRVQYHEDWKPLLDGDADAIRLKAFATPAECAGLVDLMVQHPRAVDYATAARIRRLGTSFSDVRRQAKNEREELAAAAARAYAEPDTLQEALALNGAVARLVGSICASWRGGLETFSCGGIPAHRIIARRIVGDGAEPHDDDVAKELPEDPVAASVQVQLGVNLYVEVSDDGGDLEGWRRRLSRDEYDRLRNPEPTLSYGIRREDLGPPDWTLKPSVGDVIIFRNSEVHAIRPSRGARTTWGFFLGFRNEAAPLLMWS
jgi:hypothetical protein